MWIYICSNRRIVPLLAGETLEGGGCCGSCWEGKCMTWRDLDSFLGKTSLCWNAIPAMGLISMENCLWKWLCKLHVKAVTVLTPVGLDVQHSADPVQQPWVQPRSCLPDTAQQFGHCHTCRKLWELSLGSQTSSPPALDGCTGQHWHRGVLGWLWGLCCGADPPSTVCADVVLRWGWRGCVHVLQAWVVSVAES